MNCFYFATILYGVSLIFFLLSKRKPSIFIFSLAFFVHTVSQISRGFFTGPLIIRPIFKEPFFLPWCIAMLALILIFSLKREKEGSSLILPVFLLCFIALFLPGEVFPHFLKSRTIFPDLFFLFEVLAYGFFGVGAWLALLVLLEKVPPKDRLFSSFIICGFAFYTVAQILGAIWAYLGWSSPFLWGDRHLKSVAVWVYYACFLHLFLLKRWNLKKSSYFVLIGFGFILIELFTYNFQFLWK